MVLTKADDYPIHQTPEPIAYSGTDRNFYDRYFFNGYGPNGEDFFAVAFGVYPHLNVADAHVAVIRAGVEHCIHASKVLDMERFDLEVGPIRIEILEPLQRLKVTLAPTDGMAAEFVFDARSAPIEEPRFIHRIGPRTFMDYTRLTQNGRYTGWIEIDGERRDLVTGTTGTRDRSWGVRPVGARDEQPHAPARSFGFFWQWTPLNFENRSVFFHVNADADGHAWNTRAVVLPDGAAQGEGKETEHAEMATTFIEGTRHASSGRLTIPLPNEPPITITFEPGETFLMRGIGYTHPIWGHGRYQGQPLKVERETIPVADLDRASPQNLHIQAISKVTLEQEGRPPETGVGVFEQLVLGPYAPYGFQ